MTKMAGYSLKYPDRVVLITGEARVLAKAGQAYSAGPGLSLATPWCKAKYMENKK